MSSLNYSTYARATPSISEEELRANANQIFREESAAARRKGVDVAWYAPKDVNINKKRGSKNIRPHTIHVGEHGQINPSWSDPAFDLYEKERIDKRIAKIQGEGGEITESQMLEFDLAPYVGDFWKNAAHNFWEDASGMSQQKVAAGGIVTSDENAAVNVINVLQEMLGLDRREYALVNNAVTTIATPNLTLSVDTWQGFNAYRNVGEGVEVDQQKGRITRQNFVLQKDVGSIGATDEAQMVSERPLWQIHMDHVVRAMTNIKNVKVQTALESAAVTATDIGTVDWTDYHATSINNSAVNPAAQIRAEADIIYTNMGRANTIVSGTGPLDAYLGNTYIQGNQGGTFSRETGPFVMTNVPNLPGFTWIVDPLMSANRVTIYDKSTLLVLQGPVRTAQFRKEGAGVDAYFTRDWNAVAILDATQIRALTDVVTAS
jgi:hypothetical protein